MIAAKTGNVVVVERIAIDIDRKDIILENNQIKTIAHHQRIFLVGCGLILSLVLLTIMVFLIHVHTNNSIVNKRAFFSHKNAIVVGDVTPKKYEVRRNTGYVDVEGKVDRNNSISDCDQLLSDGQKLFLERKPNATVKFAGSLISQQQFAENFFCLKKLSNPQPHTSVIRPADSGELSNGYFFDLVYVFPQIMSRPDSIWTQSFKPIALVSSVRELMPDMGHVSDPLQNPWLTPFLANNKLEKFALTRWDVNTANLTLEQSVIDAKVSALELNDPHYFNCDRTLTIRKLLSNAKRIAELPYSEEPIWIYQHWFLILIVVGTLVLLILLWCCIFFYDRTMLRPLLLSAQQVFDSEKMHRVMVVNAPGGLCLLTIDDGKVLLQNHGMQTYHNEAPCLPSRFLALSRVSNEKNNQTFPQSLGEHDLMMVDRGGQCRHLLVSLVLTRYAGRQLLLCSFLEITASKLIEKQLLDARIAADVANATKSTALAHVSHEIRTPLNSIVGNLELLARTPMTELQYDRMNIIVSSSRGLLDIINDILDFSKIESGQMSLEVIPFDLAETIEQAILLFVPLVQNKGLALFYYINPLLPRYYLGDPKRFRQIVLNLLSNAVKFTERGNIRLVLTVENGDVVLRVTDTGIGISLERQRELFQPFVQAEPSASRLFGGTGLGLALCDQLINLMNGKIAISSIKGKGTTITVRASLRTDALRPALLPSLSFESMKMVTVLCATPECWEQLVALISGWGIMPVKITHPDELTLTSAPLLLFGRQRHWCLIDEERAGLLAGCIIDILEDGPRHPIVQPGPTVRILVSCYSTSGLHDALRRALDPAILIPVISELAMQEGNSLLNTDKPHPLVAPSVHILVVEDHPLNLALVGDQLSLLGYKVTLVASAIEALQLFSPGDFDIVLTDLSMPELDGYMLAKILRQQNVLLPIIALTAHANKEEHTRCEKAGIDDILVKPVSLERLDCMIRKCLAGTTFPFPDAIFLKHDLNLTTERISVLQLSSATSFKIIFSAFSNNQAEIIQEQLHSLAGAFAICGELSIVNTCRSLENECMLMLSADLRNRLKILENVIAQTIKRRASGSDFSLEA
ncbi:ATP-binding protein [Glaciimonas sp. Gout2]|uniref:ATP-binding protein n=1 Tax=unclassified Glaciimonas TaxID=2644401 RepID=UPI002B23BF56|nr:MULTISPECIES: ATP-binding protein [unclassified Glaciimonas]MEB0010304.1 ATP-binding protein [Glaciimonas sp. Cout2]MEB0084769.1 ATP-binding protein [Glaciimonas sp. Gout2]